MAGFRVLLRVQVREGLEEAFEDQWRHGDPDVSGHPANRGHWLARVDGEERVYVVVSDWGDEPSFRAFEASEVHLSHRQAMRPFLQNGSMTTMRIVAGSSRPVTPVG